MFIKLSMGIKSSKVLESYGKSDQLITAELQRSEGLQGGAPFLSKFGNSSSLDNLVMTSPYERASERTPSVQTLGEVERSLAVTRTGERKNAIFFGGIFKEK